MSTQNQNKVNFIRYALMILPVLVGSIMGLFFAEIGNIQDQMTSFIQGFIGTSVLAIMINITILKPMERQNDTKQ